MSDVFGTWFNEGKSPQKQFEDFHKEIEKKVSEISGVPTTHLGQAETPTEGDMRRTAWGVEVFFQGQWVDLKGGKQGASGDDHTMAMAMAMMADKHAPATDKKTVSGRINRSDDIEDATIEN